MDPSVNLEDRLREFSRLSAVNPRVSIPLWIASCLLRSYDLSLFSSLSLYLSPVSEEGWKCGRGWSIMVNCAYPSVTIRQHVSPWPLMLMGRIPSWLTCETGAASWRRRGDRDVAHTPLPILRPPFAPTCVRTTISIAAAGVSA